MDSATKAGQDESSGALKPVMFIASQKVLAFLQAKVNEELAKTLGQALMVYNFERSKEAYANVLQVKAKIEMLSGGGMQLVPVTDEQLPFSAGQA